MDKIFQEVLVRCRRADFLENVMTKACYGAEDRELLWSVLEKILACVEKEGYWSERDVAQRKIRTAARQGTEDDLQGKTKEDAVIFREVVMTLGEGVDGLQEAFLQEGKLTEGYMVEVLGSEILLLAYGAYNAWVKAQGTYVVRRYHFLGTEEGEKADARIRGEEEGEKADARIRGEEEGQPAECARGEEEGQPAECARTVEGKPSKEHVPTGERPSLGLLVLPGMLERSGLGVSCTEGYCMMPKKSVAFYAELSKDMSAVCEGICVGCIRRDCPNRMESGKQERGNKTLDRPLTYGYARIFGVSG